jgi:hypothetical protein
MFVPLKVITLSVILALGFVSIAQAHDSGGWKHRNHYLRAKVSKLHGKRAPGCDLVAGKCKGKKVNRKTVNKYFSTLRSIVAPPKRVVRYVATSRPYRPPVTSSNTGGYTKPAYHPPTQTAAPSSAGAPLQAIAQCESGGSPSAVSKGGQYRGKYQFSQSTWQSVGGSGDPAAASEAEQDKRASMLYSKTGASSWPVCGR